jgi:molybdopterin converting factor small subunit
MKVKIEIVEVPMLSDIVGKKKFELNIQGKTMRELIEGFIRTYGTKIRKVFYSEKGTLDPMIQIALNGENWIPADRHDMTLNDGDTLIFKILLAGA